MSKFVETEPGNEFFVINYEYNPVDYRKKQGYGESFKNELRAHKNQIKAILCGHGHRERLGEWNGIPVALAGANFEGSAREIEFI